MPQAVLYEKLNRIGIIRLNRPEKKNAINPEILEDFSEVMRIVREDVKNDLRSVIITGSGNSFSSGIDITALQEFAEKSGYTGIVGRREGILNFYKVFLEILDIEVPTIAAINGYAYGGGLALALLCDIRIAARDAKMSLNFARVGIHPGMATTYTLRNLVGLQRACYIFFTAGTFTGEDAERWGLVLKAVDDPEKEAIKIAEEISENAPYIIKQTKKLLYSDFKAKFQAEIESLLQSLCSTMEDAVEGVKAFFEKRKPNFKNR